MTTIVQGKCLCMHVGVGVRALVGRPAVVARQTCCSVLGGMSGGVKPSSGTLCSTLQPSGLPLQALTLAELPELATLDHLAAVCCTK